MGTYERLASASLSKCKSRSKMAFEVERKDTKGLGPIVTYNLRLIPGLLTKQMSDSSEKQTKVTEDSQ